jgi:hypothetical protein
MKKMVPASNPVENANKTYEKNISKLFSITGFTKRPGYNIVAFC